MSAIPSSRRSASEQAARRPLILSARIRVRVDAQAESLVVRREPAGEQRFPVARIDRVVCGPGASWSGAALTLCLERGIAITWVSAQGVPLGDAAPRLANPSSLDACLDRFLERPSWAASYGNWLRRRRLAILVRWARGRRDRAIPVSAGEWAAYMRDYVHNARPVVVYPLEMFAWCRSVAIARLGQAGLRSRYWAYDGQPLDLAEDIAGLLWAEINFEHAGLGGGVQEPRAAATTFEASGTSRTDSLREHLALLNLHVCRAIDEWH